VIVCGKEIMIRGRLIRIASPELDKYELLNDPEAVLDGLRKSDTRIDLVTFMQAMPETTIKYTYTMEWDNLAVLPVSTFDHWWEKQLGFKARNKARQAEKKGVTFKEVAFDDTLVRGIWEVYNESPIRQGKPNVHYGKDVDTVRRDEATYLDRSIFIGAFLGDKLIGFVKLVADETRTQAGLMNILAMIQHRDKSVTNALIAQAVRSCAERGIRYLVYSHFAYGNKQRDSLSDFKESNGFQRINLPRYYVPLTRTGLLAFRLGLHHPLVDRLPETIASKLRELRKAWYERKFRTATEAR
jgi:hypothetical protein